MTGCRGGGGGDGWSGNAAIIANNPFHDLQCLEMFVLCVSWRAVKTRRVVLPRWVILSSDVSEYTSQLIHSELDTTVWVRLWSPVLGKKAHRVIALPLVGNTFWCYDLDF